MIYLKNEQYGWNKKMKITKRTLNKLIESVVDRKLNENYYVDQLNTIDLNDPSGHHIKITNGSTGKGTKWFTLNYDSALELRDWLDDNFINK